MRPDRWGQVKDLFGLALEHEPEQRAAFLQKACADDPALRAEVESLLASYKPTSNPSSDAGALLDTSAESATRSVNVMEGQRIGPYKIICQIGQGGMATVCLALRADDEYKKRVAIKLLKRGMDSEEILRRFRNERQMLAALDHPNIVKLLDGGSTADGLPYLVMDYVEGMPITDYCDNRKLSIAERLSLFRIICGAVHYAHQNLVIHRDLKPGNILVTPEGVPKLLDFGIAKLLNPEFSPQTLLVTEAHRLLMTPEYASPEQVRGQPITTATDVYSLGVLLYELLTGHRPYIPKNRTLPEIQRVVCEVEPEKPSTIVGRQAESPVLGGTPLTPEFVSQTREGRPEKLQRRLLGDLDNIVIMALRKEPQRRYASVEQFSHDILRHLEGLPVTARPATWSYRSSKFIQRHTAGVSAAAIVVLILIVGIISTAREARIARAEKTRAERRFNDVRRLANSFLFDFHNAIANLPGSTPARRLVVDKAREYLDSLSQEAQNDRELTIELGTSYLKLGDVQGGFYGANLGDTSGAVASYRKATRSCEELCRRNPKDSTACRCLALAYRGTGEALWILGDVSGAVENLRKTLPLFEALFTAPNATISDRIQLPGSYLSLGDKLGNPTIPNLGLVFQSLEAYRKALELLEPMLAAQRTDLVLRRGVALTHEKLAQLNAEIGDVEGSLDHYREADTTFEQLSLSDPTNARAHRDLALNRTYFARALMEAGDLAEALKTSKDALRVDDDLRKVDPQNVQMSEDTALTHGIIGEILSKTGNPAGALEHFRAGLAIIEPLLMADPKNILIRAGTSQGLTSVADSLIKLGKVDEADSSPAVV